ncbi:unnamed protein product, partial [Hapterophycus canaliculatus]
MIGRAVLGEKFMPPHFLKLSQALKHWGVGAKPMSLLASWRMCFSDRVRYHRESFLTKHNGEDLVTRNLRKAVAAAWDNNDFDPTPRFGTAGHGSAIGATSHEHISEMGLTLGGEEAWTPYEDVTATLVEYGRDRGAHDDIKDSFMANLLKVMRNSPEYLLRDEGPLSCLEVEVRKFLPAAETKVNSRNLFLVQGSTKSQADCHGVLEKLAEAFHVNQSWYRDAQTGQFVSRIERRVLVEGDQETYGFMVEAKRGRPQKYKWVMAHPGGWHLMMHLGKALLYRYYGAGVESVAKLLG